MKLLIFSTSTDVSTKLVSNQLLIKYELIFVDKLEIKDLSDLIARNYSNTVVWLRRGNFLSLFSDLVNKEFGFEYMAFVEYLFYKIEVESHVVVGSLLKDYNHNKLIDLLIAHEIGLNVPKTFVTTANQVPNIDGPFITKMARNALQFKYNEKIYHTGNTKRVTKRTLLENESVFPSLVQEEVMKLYEYSMAIFSQENSETQLDYRNYSKKNPNRLVPYVLNEKIRNKIFDLMEKLNLNTGSIDLIYSTDNEYIFLEVNPCGQFDWLSGNCNYEIEYDIANYFNKFENE